jgi:hypothetical protein
VNGNATVRLSGRLRADAMSLLESRLNRTPAPPVDLAPAADAVSFHACTWQPLLLARVEDAMDEVFGPTWRSEFILA